MLAEMFYLYRKCFRGKLLHLICDCCYSGQWIQRCGEALDSMNVGACGHQAREHNILIKISTACLPGETAWDTQFSSSGVTLGSDGRLKFHAGKDIGPKHHKQTTLFMDFTKARCFSKTEDSCQLDSLTVRWNWKEITNNSKKDHLKLWIVRMNDKGRQCWHTVLVVDSKHSKQEAFKADVKSGNFDLADYGHIISSGWGEDPPEETKKLLQTYGPTST